MVPIAVFVVIHSLLQLGRIPGEMQNKQGGRVPNEMQHFLEIETGMEMVKIPCEWKKVEAFKWVENISPRKAGFLLRNGYLKKFPYLKLCKTKQIYPPATTSTSLFILNVLSNSGQDCFNLI